MSEEGYFVPKTQNELQVFFEKVIEKLKAVGLPVKMTMEKPVVTEGRVSFVMKSLARNWIPDFYVPITVKQEEGDEILELIWPHIVNKDPVEDFKQYLVQMFPMIDQTKSSDPLTVEKFQSWLYR